MQWPDELLIDFILHSTKEKISNLFVSISVVANRKNNYSIGDFLTDSNGRISIKRDRIEREIASSLHDYPMDYSDRLEDLDKLKITIETKKRILERIEKVKEFYPDYSNVLLDLMNRAKFICDKEIIKTVEINPTMKVYNYEI